MTMLNNYKWQPAWVSQLGCLKAAADYLNVPLSPGWLYGGTGHAFIINIHKAGCASGPTAWRMPRILNLAHNLGLSVQGVCGSKSDKDYATKKLRAYDTVKAAVENGLPCYGWELDIPEYYSIIGYDNTGFYYSGPTTGASIAGPKPWAELGETQIGMLEVYVVEPGYSADDRIVIREALEFALEHAQSPADWIYPNYKAGLAGYDLWIEAVRHEEQDVFGLAYNAAVWHECRYYAVEFLQEAKVRLGGHPLPALDQAIQSYTQVRDELALVKDIYPFPPNQSRPDRVRAGDALSKARVAEATGLRALEDIVTALT
ncbi:MAG: Uncharacterized protein FD169_1727 [Bacillota bacterium]|nr:MAG: Uncharacterized protein FD169_1727 [Bacillota bacterium]MBS3950919.1 hypothetical protein [Peptococcaceae bacterium]